MKKKNEWIQGTIPIFLKLLADHQFFIVHKAKVIDNSIKTWEL